MNNMELMYEGYETETLSDFLSQPEILKLVREINHSFGLKAYAYTDAKRVRMCNSHGLPVCELWTRSNDHLETEYCYASPFYKKQRGRSEQDRMTVFSNKLSVLMTTLKRNKCVPSLFDLYEEIIRNVRDGVNQVKDSMIKGSKNHYSMETEIIHALLKVGMGEAPPSILADHDTEKLRKFLDSWNSIDDQHKELKRTVEENFNNGFYAIGTYHSGHYFVGMLKRNPQVEGGYEVIEPFKRMKHLMEKTELIPIITMMKVSLEGKRNVDYRGNDVKLPEDLNTYDVNLGVSYRSPAKRGLLNYSLVLVPCNLV